MRPCDHAHDAEPAPGCRVCELYFADPAYHALWEGPGLVGCRHLGWPTGERRPCPSCRGSVEVKLRACAVHGACTEHKPLPGVACCAGCPDREARPVLQLECTSQGIGDGVVCLALATGLARARPDAEVVLAAPGHVVPWLALQAGPVRLLRSPLPGVPAVRPYSFSDPVLARHRATRWGLWGAAAGAEAELPACRRPRAGDAAWAERWRDCVALFPGCEWADRVWPGWRELEGLLAASGRRCVVLDSRGDRLEGFASEWLAGEPPPRVAAVMRAASLVLANDSGMAHVAGLLGVPALAVCGAVPGERIFGLYPSVGVVDSPTRRLADTPAAAVLARAEAALAETEPALWGVLRELCRRRPPASYLEVGVREGDSLRVVLAGGHPARLALADTWGGDYGGSGRGGHGHVEALLGRLGYRGGVLWLDGDSRATLPGLAGQTFDLVAVDGDHSAEGARADLEACLPLLAPGGRLVLDDVRHPAHPYLADVGREFLARHAGLLELEREDGRGNGVLVFRRRA